MKDGDILFLGEGSPEHLILDSDVSIDTFERYVLLCTALNAADALHNTLPIVEANCAEIESLIAEVETETYDPIDPGVQQAVSLELNRRAVNFLSAFIMFVDHLKVHFNRTYGDATDEFLAFKRLTNQQFDGIFAYRFCSKLRNYLHCGLPLTHISTSQTPDNSGKIVHKYSVGFDTEVLLSRFDGWGAILSKELSMKRDFIPAAHLFEEAMNSLKALFAAANEIDRPRLLQYSAELRDMVQPAFKQNRRPSFAKVSQIDGNEFVLRKYELPIPMMERLGTIKVQYRIEGSL